MRGSIQGGERRGEQSQELEVGGVCGRGGSRETAPNMADAQLLAHQRCRNAAMLTSINPGNPRGFGPQKPG